MQLGPGGWSGPGRRGLQTIGSKSVCPSQWYMISTTADRSPRARLVRPPAANMSRMPGCCKKPICDRVKYTFLVESQWRANNCNVSGLSLSNFLIIGKAAKKAVWQADACEAVESARFTNACRPSIQRSAMVGNLSRQAQSDKGCNMSSGSPSANATS